MKPYYLIIIALTIVAAFFYYEKIRLETELDIIYKLPTKIDTVYVDRVDTLIIRDTIEVSKPGTGPIIVVQPPLPDSTSNRLGIFKTQFKDSLIKGVIYSYTRDYLVTEQFIEYSLSRPLLQITRTEQFTITEKIYLPPRKHWELHVGVNFLKRPTADLTVFTPYNFGVGISYSSLDQRWAPRIAYKVKF